MPSPVALLRPFAEEAVEAYRALDARLRMTSPSDIDLVAIAAEMGAFVQTGRLAHETAHVLRAGRIASITIDPEKSAGYAWRTALGHEMGHVACDDAHDDFARCTIEKPTRATAHVEKRATDFGTLVTMPERMFEPRWRTRSTPSIDAIRWMARVFAVPTESAALRALRFEEEACAVVFSTVEAKGERPRVKWWARGHEGFDAAIFWRRKVNEATLAYALHAGAAERGMRARTVPDVAWGKTPDGADIVEHATRVAGGVLTWLWIPGRKSPSGD